MPIRIPGTQTGPFGGPQGSTLQAMLQLMQGYLAGEKRAEEQKQMDLLGKIFGQQPGQPIQPTTRENIVEQILSNRELKPRTRMLGLKAAQALPRYKSPDYMVLKYWDKNGKKHQKRILTSEFNSKTAEIEAAGGSWEGPEATRKIGDTRTFPRKGKQITQEWNGQKWVPLATSPQWKPDKSDIMNEQSIRKELTRLEGIKRQAEKTGGMNDVLFAMIAERNPQLAEKMRQNPEHAFDELDRYMNFLRDKLPEGAAGKPTRWVIENGQFIQK